MTPLLTTLALPPDVLPARQVAPSSHLVAEIRPIGFGPDGKLALLYVAPDEAVGCAQWSVQIVDLKTDGVSDRVTPGDGCDVDAAAGWAREHEAIVQLLGRHAIEPGTPSLATLPVQHGADRLDARLRVGAVQQLAVEEEGQPPTVRVPVEVVFRSSERGEKTVGTLYVEERWGLSMTWGHEVVGYVASPHEPRVAVLVREVHRGWEGLPTVEVVHVMGAALETGFTPSP